MRLLLLGLVVVGCATTGKLEERMKARLGQNINQVVTEIGPPHTTFKRPDGATVYTWNNAAGSKASDGAFGGVVITDYGCRVSYTAGDNGVITNYAANGNYCKSR